MGGFAFWLPPLPEQHKIAAILSSVDHAIEKAQAVIDQVQVVKRGLMQELLTRGLPGRHTRFKQTEFGQVPEAWIEIDLGSVIELKRGYDLPRQHRTIGAVPVVSSSGVTDTHGEARVKGPGVVTGRYGNIGQVFFVNDDFLALEHDAVRPRLQWAMISDSSATFFADSISPRIQARPLSRA